MRACVCMCMCMGPSIKYVTILLANFGPLPLSHFVTHPGPPKISHTSRTPPRFLVGLVQKAQAKAPCTNSLSIVRGSFCPEVLSEDLLSERFCPEWVLSVPPCWNTSVTTER